MRTKELPTTMGELMGNNKEISLDNLHEVLGDKMPEIPFNRVGKLRLIHALHERFGINYRNIPGVTGVLNEFEKHVNTNNVIKQNKEGLNNEC